MGLDGKWLVSRMGVGGSAILQDRSVLSITTSGGTTSAKFMKSDNTFSASLTLTVTGNLFRTSANPYISGQLVTMAEYDYEFLTGWISDTQVAKDRTQMDAFVAVRSPFQGKWKIFSLSSTGSTALVEADSTLDVDGVSVTFTKPNNGGTHTFSDVEIGADAVRKERSSANTYRLDAKLVRRGNVTFLFGTIGFGSGSGPWVAGYDPLGDSNTDTFTAVKISPAG